MTRHAAWNRRATNEQIIEAYAATGSVWAAGKRLGLTGGSVHERLRALGHPLGNRSWTKAEHYELESLIAAQVPLGEIAHRLGRPYAGVASRASRYGLRSVQVRPKKIPRGAGYDKASVGRHLRNLERSGTKITRYARAEGLNVELLAKAIERHFPDRWAAYRETHAALPTRTCEYCETAFIPGSGKQRYCTRDCARTARADRDYFGWNRRHTVGLAEGVCQLCARRDVKGLSSHHVVGKENDPDNLHLVALCQGCHHLVTMCASRTFVDDPRAWEALIALAWTRYHGAEPVAEPQVLYTEVLIETWDAADDDDFEVIPAPDHPPKETR